MALPQTPFSPDPGYENTCNFYPKGSTFDPAPRGRVRPEASAIARLHTAGSLAFLFQPEQERPQRYTRPEPKSHARENLRRIREIQAQSRQKREEEATKPVKPVYKSDKYDHVQAKVTVHMQHTHPYTSPTPHNKLPVKTSVHQHRSPLFQLEPTPRDQRVPVNGTPVEDHHGVSSTDTSQKKHKNFLSRNIRCVGSFQVRRPPSRERLEALVSKRERGLAQYKRGELPPYLRRRQEEWRRAEEERVASLPDPSIPPGHSLMPDHERTRTLQALREHQSSLTRELQSLPIRSDTLRVQSRRRELEGRLAEIDDAIKIFSRPKVFVKLDE